MLFLWRQIAGQRAGLTFKEVDFRWKGSQSIGKKIFQFLLQISDFCACLKHENTLEIALENVLMFLEDFFLPGVVRVCIEPLYGGERAFDLEMHHTNA